MSRSIKPMSVGSVVHISDRMWKRSPRIVGWLPSGELVCERVNGKRRWVVTGKPPIGVRWELD